MATKSYALSKKKVREMIEEKFEGEETISKAAVLELFASADRGATGETTLVFDGDEVVGKRCSYFGLYLPISEFGTMGKEEDGSVKYAYQSKPAQKLLREKKKEVDEMKEKIEAELDETGDLDAWREAKSELAEFEATKGEVPEDIIATETAEDLISELA